MRIRSVAPLLLLVLVWIASEAVPFLAGTGSDIAFDWSFLYVTLRWFLIPLACVFVAVTSAITFFRTTGQAKVSAAAKAIIALAIGALQWFHQWPLFVRHP
jgi:hypothetical protein